MGIEERGGFEIGQLYSDIPNPVDARIARAQEMEEVFKRLGGEVPVFFEPRDGYLPIKLRPLNFQKNNK